MGSRVKRVVRLAILTAAATLLAAVFTQPAFAVVTWSNATPSPNSTVNVASPPISVKATDPSGINSSSKQMKIDGVTVYPRWSNITGGGLITYQPSTLAAGTHTVWVSVLPYAGGRQNYQWTFSVSIKPTITALTPADGATVTTTTPVVSAVITAAGGTPAAFAMAIDGAAVAASWNAGTKTLSFGPDLRNDAVHTVSVAATDSAGATVTASWSFSVQIYPDMTGAPSCTACHTTFPSAHPMGNCAGCHGTGSPVGEGWSDPPDTPHGADHITALACTSCHMPTYPDVPRHPADLTAAHTSSSDMSGCACHVRSLTVEHNRHTTAVGAPFTCETCHTSTDASVEAAIAAGDTRCTACHVNLSGDGHGVLHETDFDAASCNGCHSANLMTEHVTNRGLTCDACHNDPTHPEYAQAVAWGQNHCSDCHTAAHGQTLSPSVPASIPLDPAFAFSDPIPADTFAGEDWMPASFLGVGAHMVVSNRLATTPDEVWAYYRDAMLTQGWTVASGTPAPGDPAFTATFVSGRRHAVLWCYPGEDHAVSPPSPAGMRVELAWYEEVQW